MRVFLDTNIIIDVLSNSRREHRDASRMVLHAIQTGELEGFITTQSIIDTQYILSKESGFSQELFRRKMLTIMSFVNVTQIDSMSIRDALKNPTGDFEYDAQFYQADSEGLDIIVTSDHRFLERQTPDGPLFLTPEGIIERMS